MILNTQQKEAQIVIYSFTKNKLKLKTEALFGHVLESTAIIIPNMNIPKKRAEKKHFSNYIFV